MLFKLKTNKASKEDAEDIIEYLNIIGGESDYLLFGKNEFKDISIEREMKIIEKMNLSAKSVMYVGKINDEIVSIGSLYGISNRARVVHRGELAISVKKKYWNKGIASKMMEKLISFAKDVAKLEIIQLDVRSDNLNAIKLYKKFGFEEIGLYEKYFKIEEEYFDAVMMNLYL